MFQFPWFASHHVMPRLQHGGLSHSEIPASTAICASTGLIAAYHVLHRLREPRHPPVCPCLLPSSPTHLDNTYRRGDRVYFRLSLLYSFTTLSGLYSMSMNEPFRDGGRGASQRPRACIASQQAGSTRKGVGCGPIWTGHPAPSCLCLCLTASRGTPLQKGGVPAAPSGTATLLRLSPNHRFHPRPILAVTDFRCPRLSWLDGRCVQGPGTYSPRHG